MSNLNENPREGFAVVSACTDNWRQIMDSRYNSQEERLLKLEHSLLTMNTVIQKSQSLNLGIQADQWRIDALVTQHKNIIPRLNHEVEIASPRVNTVLSLYINIVYTTQLFSGSDSGLIDD